MPTADTTPERSIASVSQLNVMKPSGDSSSSNVSVPASPPAPTTTAPVTPSVQAPPFSTSSPPVVTAMDASGCAGATPSLAWPEGTTTLSPAALPGTPVGLQLEAEDQSPVPPCQVYAVCAVALDAATRTTPM